MPTVPVTVEQLEQTREAILDALQKQFTGNDAQFLLGFKQGNPNWSLFHNARAAE